MISAEERRRKLEALLQRVKSKRAALTAGKSRPTPLPEATETIPEEGTDPDGLGALELPVTGAELEASDVLFEETGPDLELFGDAEDDDEQDEATAVTTMELGEDSVIELTMDAEVAEEDEHDRPTPVSKPAEPEHVIELSADEEVAEEDSAFLADPVAPAAKDETDTIEVEEPPEAARQAAAAAYDSADEPEIEISYGTDEAMALQEELGLAPGGVAKPATAPIGGDLQLHPADRPTPPSLTPGLTPTEPSPTGGAAKGERVEPLPDLPPLDDLPAAVTPASRPVDLPARPESVTATTLTPAAARFAGAEPSASANVAAFVSEAQPARARTLGDLLRAALAVGKRR